MGTFSYLLVGEDLAMKETFGSICHGAGREMSRSKAKKTTNANDVINELKKNNIHLQARSKSGITEEAPIAYKGYKSSY